MVLNTLKSMPDAAFPVTEADSAFYVSLVHCTHVATEAAEQHATLLISGRDHNADAKLICDYCQQIIPLSAQFSHRSHVITIPQKNHVFPCTLGRRKTQV